MTGEGGADFARQLDRLQRAPVNLADRQGQGEGVSSGKAAVWGSLPVPVLAGGDPKGDWWLFIACGEGVCSKCLPGPLHRESVILRSPGRPPPPRPPLCLLPQPSVPGL